MNKKTAVDQRFDARILKLIPHRPPMLLINQLISVSANESCALVLIDQKSPFYQPHIGVPSWIGLEYMGQTAALIAGFQMANGKIDSHIGFLLGSRYYNVAEEFFSDSTRLVINCVEVALVGESLATFDCTIHDELTKQQLAEANLSVFRKPVT